MIITYDLSCSDEAFDIEQCYKSAKSGYAEAQYNLALCHAKGTKSHRSAKLARIVNGKHIKEMEAS